MPKRDIDEEMSQIVFRHGAYVFVVPKEVHELYQGRERQLLEEVIEQLRIILKISTYRLRGFEHSIRFTWHGLNPRIVIEAKLFPDDINHNIVELQKQRRQELQNRVNNYLEKVRKS